MTDNGLYLGQFTQQPDFGDENPSDPPIDDVVSYLSEGADKFSTMSLDRDAEDDLRL